MSFILGNDMILIPLFGIVVFVFSYFTSDRIIEFLSRKSLGNREIVMEMMDRMFMDVDKKRVTILLLLVSFGLGIALFLLMWPHVMFGLAFGSIVTVIGWTIPKYVMTALWDRRCVALTNQMVDGMTIMANGIRAGQSLTQAMERVVENLKGPLPQEFGLVLNKVRLGMAVEDALNEFGQRIPKQDVQMFVTSVNILKETGGNLAETFTTIVNTVRERQKIEKKIQALTAQGQMQAIILTLVPCVLLGVFFVLDPNFIMPLFTKPLGWVALAMMLTLQIIGLFVMKKIVTIKV
jgi:tight adherence protein B